MSDIVIGVRVDQLTGLGIGMDGSKAEILHMIGAALLIEEHIPIRPSRRPIIEIIDHGAAISFSQLPALQAVPTIMESVTSFGQHQVLIRKGFMDPLNVLIHLPASAPVLIPVKPHAPGIFSGLRIAQYSTGLLIQQVAVMIPYDDLLIAQSLFCQSRP